MKVIQPLCLSVLLLSATFIQAGQEGTSLRSKVRQSLESMLAAQVKGIENCENKCDKAFNHFAYDISVQTNQQTFEFQACVKGCNQCQQNLDSNTTVSLSQCFTMCKNFDWTTLGITKGVIEPDKACIGGCVINTCQVICQGGTTDPEENKSNKDLFFPNGGCSIKTQPYSQYLEYVPWNSPNTGQGGSQDVARCCANAVSLCAYVGPTTTTNYVQLLSNTKKFCLPFVPSGTKDDICAFYSVQRNCGQLAG